MKIIKNVLLTIASLIVSVQIMSGINNGSDWLVNLISGIALTALMVFVWQKVDSKYLKINNVVEETEDEIYGDAKILINECDTVSASFLQRRLKIGYARAARLLDRMEEEGIISQNDYPNPRKVLKKTSTE